MKVLQLVCYALAVVLVTTAFESCSSGLGNNLPNPDSTETSQASTNFPLGVELGVALSSPAEDAVVAGVVIPAFGANTEREVVLLAFATASDGVALSRDTVTDGNGASDVFAAVLCAQEVETAAFSQSLAGKFRHPRCATCHSMRATGTTAFQSAAAIGQPHAGPLPGPATFPAGADECIQCHTQQTSFPVVGWQAPDESFNFRGKTVAELAQAAMNVPFDETEHFVTDPRVLWALDSGILPVVGGRNGVADDDHDGIDEPTDTDGIARPVPGGSETFIQQIEDWRAAGMPVTPGDAVCDVTLVSRAGATTAAPNGASSKPQVLFVPNGAFTGPGTVGTLFVVFQSDATDVVGTDTNGASDVFVTSLDLVASGDGSLDLQVNGAATLCSEANGGGDTANGASGNPVIGGAAADMVAFESEATDLVAGFVAGTGSNVYVHQVGGSTTLVSHADGSATTGANGASSQPSISADGTTVAFESDATDLLSIVDANGVRDVFYADISGAAPFLRMRASVTSSGGEGSGGASGDASVAVTGGGRTLIAFESDKTNLDGTVTATTNVYLYDSQSNATLLLNRLLSPSLDRIGDGSARNPVIGPDGASVAFESDASNIDVLRTDQNNATDVFLVDTSVALGGAVLPYRFSLTTVEATDADGASTLPQFGTFASPSSNYQVGFAVYKTEAGNLGTTDSNDLVVTFLDETSGVVADLSASVTSGVAPLTVQFTDRSTGVPTAWQWDFDNDGNVDSTEQNPSFTYTTPGTYTVVLTASNASSTNTATKTDLVRAIGVPTVDFTPSVTQGEVPFDVTFSDNGTTEQPTSWSWDFGDGTTSTTAPPVTHTYSSAGTYTVALTATNEAGSSTETKTGLIQAVVPINASFTTNPSPATGAVPLVVDFDASGSAGATSFAWDFGDGSSGTGETTQHTYTSGGVFTVTLTATSAGGINLMVFALGFAPLPWGTATLDAFGLPYCSVLVQPELLVPVVSPLTQVPLQIAIPVQTNLLGASLYAQALDIGATSSVSHAMRLRIGGR